MDQDRPEKLSDVNIHLHGYTQDDVINNRKAAINLVKDAAIKGDTICLQTMWLDAQAKQLGIDMDYSEELDEEDLI